MSLRGEKKTHTPKRHHLHQHKHQCGQCYVGGRASSANIFAATRWAWFNYVKGRALSPAGIEWLHERSYSSAAASVQLCCYKLSSVDIA